MFLQVGHLPVTGAYVYPNGDSFSGDLLWFDRWGFLPHGNGTYWGNGRKYMGKFHMGWWHGQGILWERNNNGFDFIFSGQWMNGHLELLNSSFMINKGHNNPTSQDTMIFKI